MIAAPKKAPSVWNIKYTGNFLHFSLPKRQRANVTAGFKCPPKKKEEALSSHKFIHKEVFYKNSVQQLRMQF